MGFIHDVRTFSEQKCLNAIHAFECEIGKGRNDPNYKAAIDSLNARIAEIHGKHIGWVT